MIVPCLSDFSISYPGRFTQAEDAAPWDKIKLLRRLMTPDVPLAQLIKGIEASQLTAEQMTRLGPEFPTLTAALSNHAWISLYQRFPEVATPRGLLLTSENIPIIQGLAGSMLSGDWQKAVFLRMTETREVQKDINGGRFSVHSVTFMFLTQDLTFVSGGGFYYGIVKDKGSQNESQ